LRGRGRKEWLTMGIRERARKIAEGGGKTSEKDVAQLHRGGEHAGGRKRTGRRVRACPRTGSGVVSGSLEERGRKGMRAGGGDGLPSSSVDISKKRRWGRRKKGKGRGGANAMKPRSHNF